MLIYYKMKGFKKKRLILIISIILFITIFSTNINAANNNISIIEKIQSPEMTFPLIIIIIIIIISDIILYLKKNLENKNKPSSEYVNKKDQQKEEKLMPENHSKINIRTKQKKKLKKGKTKKEIVDYIIQASKKGLDDENIKSNLLNAGWKKEDIETTFDEINNL